MIKVGIDLDCLLENRGFSRIVLDMHSDNVQIHLTTETANNLDKRLSMLFNLFPKLKRINLFTRKEDCRLHVNKVNTPADWFEIRTRIVRLINEV